MITREREELMRYIDEKTEAAAPRRILRLADVPTAAELPEQRVEWLVEGLIPAGGVTLVAGESGTYKTWLALCLARGVATGTEFLGRTCREAPVLYLDRENPAALVRERLALLWMERLSAVRIWGGWLEDQPPAIGDARLVEIARESKPLIIFDSLIRFHQQDENSATAMSAVMYELRQLANAGAAVVVLHHKPKGDGSQYRGSSDIRAGVDVAFAVSAAASSLDAEAAAPGRSAPARLLKFTCFKNRLAPEFALTLRPAIETQQGFVVTDSPAASRHADEVARLRELIAAHPGQTQGELFEQCGLPEKRATELLRRHEGDAWESRRGKRKTLRYFPLRESDPEPGGTVQ